MQMANKLALDRNIYGVVDNCNGRFVTGWAVDFNSVEQSLEIVLKVDKQIVATAMADQYRSDLSKNPALFGTNHAYNIVIPVELCDGKIHEILVIESSTGKILKNTPCQIEFPDITQKKSTSGIMAMIGKEDWLFLFNDSNQAIHQYTGDIKLDSKTIDDYKKHYEQLTEFYSERGIYHLLVVVPGKEYIYPEFLPDGISKAIDSDVKQRFKEVANSILKKKVFDLEPVLLSNKSKGQLYFKTDSHWNFLAAEIASGAIIDNLREEFKSIPRIDTDRYKLDIRKESSDPNMDLSMKEKVEFLDGKFVKIQKESFTFDGEPI